MMFGLGMRDTVYHFKNVIIITMVCPIFKDL